VIVIVISVMVILCCYSRLRRWPVLSIVRATRRNQRSSLPTANTWCKTRNLMIKYLLIPAVLASFQLASTVVYGQTTGKAPCGSFQKLPNGKWNVVRPVKIENGRTSVIINPGTTIGPGTRVLGTDIYAALQQSCH